MRYVILAKGGHTDFIRQLVQIGNERLLDRTIRQLRENGIQDIYVTGEYTDIDAEVINPQNNSYDYQNDKGYWLDAFNGFLDKETCFIWGDVYFSDNAIKTIVQGPSDTFYCSYHNQSKDYIKIHDEPFAYKVSDIKRFKEHIDRCKEMYDKGLTYRNPIVWELYRSLNNIDINRHILRNNAVIINDITCDIDTIKDVYRLRLKVGGNMVRVKCRNVDFTYSNFDKVKELIRANSQLSEPGHIYPNDTFLVSDSEAKYLTEDAGWVKDNHTPLVDIIEVIPEENKADKKEKEEKTSDEKPKKRVTRKKNG